MFEKLTSEQVGEIRDYVSYDTVFSASSRDDEANRMCEIVNLAGRALRRTEEIRTIFYEHFSPRIDRRNGLELISSLDQLLYLFDVNENLTGGDKKLNGLIPLLQPICHEIAQEWTDKIEGVVQRSNNTGIDTTGGTDLSNSIVARVLQDIRRALHEAITGSHSNLDGSFSLAQHRSKEKGQRSRNRELHFWLLDETHDWVYMRLPTRTKLVAGWIAPDLCQRIYGLKGFVAANEQPKYIEEDELVLERFAWGLCRAWGCAGKGKSPDVKRAREDLLKWAKQVPPRGAFQSVAIEAKDGPDGPMLDYAGLRAHLQEASEYQFSDLGEFAFETYAGLPSGEELLSFVRFDESNI